MAQQEQKGKVIIMEKNCFVVNTPNAYWWFPTKDDAEIYINKKRLQKRGL